MYDCVIWYMSCVSSHPLLFLFAWQTLLSFVVGVPYRFSRLLIRHLAMLPRSFVIFGVGVPTCGANLYLSWGVIVGDFNSKPVGFHLGYSVSDLLSIALRWVRGPQLCVPDWPFYNRHPVKWLDQIPTSAPEKKTN